MNDTVEKVTNTEDRSADCFELHDEARASQDKLVESVKRPCLSEIELLKWENELLKRELALEKEKSLKGSCSDLGSEVRGNSPSTSKGTGIKVGMTEIAALIPLFDPRNTPKTTAEEWIANIESLANIYAWDEKTKLLYSSLRLGGAAKYWQESNRNFLNWSEFKVSFCKSFPSVIDTSAVLVEIMTRRKRSDECVETYFYHIASLAARVSLSEKDTMSYIISGLNDKNMIGMLTTANCNSLLDLLQLIKKIDGMRDQQKYRDMLCSDSLQSGGRSKRESAFPKRNERYKRPRLYEEKIVRCFKCNKEGHKSFECKNVELKGRKCFKCGEIGHFAREFPRKHDTKEVRKVEQSDKESLDEYHKEVMVQGKVMTAFIDMGSQCTIMKIDAAERNGWKNELGKTNRMLIAFGGTEIKVLGTITKKVAIDDVEIEVEIMVVENHVQKEDLILGRNFIDHLLDLQKLTLNQLYPGCLLFGCPGLFRIPVSTIINIIK